jgi:hypothetical protein
MEGVKFLTTQKFGIQNAINDNNYFLIYLLHILKLLPRIKFVGGRILFLKNMETVYSLQVLMYSIIWDNAEIVLAQGAPAEHLL